MTKAPEKKKDLSTLIAEGDCDAVRAFFDDAFYNNERVVPTGSQLLSAASSFNRPLTRLLITWGATLTEDDVLVLRSVMREDYGQYVTFLRQCGLREGLVLSEELSVSPEEKPASVDAAAPGSVKVAGDQDLPDDQPQRECTLLPREWHLVLKAFQDHGAGEAVIAGGALRDFFNERPVKDVDIFMVTRGDAEKNESFIRTAFRQAGLGITAQEVGINYFGSLFSELPKPEKGRLGNMGGDPPKKASLTESWRVIAGPDKTEYNIIFTDRYVDWNQERLARGFGFAVRLITSFDFGLCQIACDGRRVISTPAYQADVSRRRIRLLNDGTKNKEHLQRIVKKYPNWELCEESKKMLAHPLKKFFNLGF